MRDELHKATQDRAAVEEEGKAVPGSCWASHMQSRCHLHSDQCARTLLENRRQEHVQTRAPQSSPRFGTGPTSSHRLVNGPATCSPSHEPLVHKYFHGQSPVVFVASSDLVLSEPHVPNQKVGLREGPQGMTRCSVFLVRGQVRGCLWFWGELSGPWDPQVSHHT